MHEGHQVENLLGLYDKRPLPPPPKPEDIDCVIAGFPWCPIAPSFLFINKTDKILTANLTHS
jgi:DNA (cytosine-5)-methyltransferase 1